MIQVAEGGLQEVQNILIRLRELGVQAASDTIGDEERRYLDEEYQSLKEEIDRIANVTEFNGTVLLDGTGGTLDIQVNTGGLNLLGVDRISFDAFKSDVNADKLGLEELGIRTKEDAQRSLAFIDRGIKKFPPFEVSLVRLITALKRPSKTSLLVLRTSLLQSRGLKTLILLARPVN